MAFEGPKNNAIHLLDNSDSYSEDTYISAQNDYHASLLTQASNAVKEHPIIKRSTRRRSYT